MQGLEVSDSGSTLPVPLDPAMLIQYHLAVATWQLGFPDHARTHLHEALERAQHSSRATDRVWIQHQAAALCTLLRDPDAVLAHAERALAECAEGSSPMDAAVATIMRGWALAQQGQPEHSLQLPHEGIETLSAMGQRLGQEFYHCLLADVHAIRGDLPEALRALADGEDICPSQLSSRSGTLVRRADLLARQGAAPADVQATYDQTLEWARGLGARSFELRAATAYARWLRKQGRAAEAHALLAPVFTTFTEGFDTRDLREAAALLDDPRARRQNCRRHPP